MELIIRSVELRNIRSYVHGRIDFPRGRVVLLGDIGAGKSTVLMSIEFALFGLGDQDGSSLLRVNENRGEVMLDVEINGRLYKIRRALRRKNGKVQQERVIVESDGKSISLAPTEAKPYIMRLLNYNEPPNPRARSTIFRYAVYTPQEEMKRILNANPDERKKTIRKAFRIEDYSNASENAAIVLDFFKTKIKSHLESAIGLDELNEEIEKISESLDDIQRMIESGKRRIKDMDTHIEDLRIKKEDLDSEIKEISRKVGILKSKKKDLENANLEYERTRNEIYSMESEYKTLMQRHNENKPVRNFQSTRDEVEYELNEIDRIVKEMNIRRAELGHRSGQLKEVRKNIKNLEISIPDTSVLQREIEEIKNEIKDIRAEKPMFEEDQLKSMELDVDNEIEEIREKISRIKSKIDDYRNIISNGICPTCDREVEREEFLPRLESKENEYLDYTSRLNDLRKKREKIKKELENLSRYRIYEEKIKRLNEKEKILMEFNDNRKKIEEQLREYRRLESELEMDEKEMKELEERLSRMESRKKELNLLRKTIEVYEKKMEEYEREGIRIESMKREIDLRRKNLESLNSRIESLKMEIHDLESSETILSQKEKELKKIKEMLENMENERIKLNESIVSLTARMDEQSKLLKSKMDEKMKKERDIRLAQKYSEYQRWIREIFIPAMEDVERTVLEMRRVEFNDSFRRWFFTLVDDSTKSARIDEDFTPVVEQDGYVQDLEYLSGGERSAVALSYRLSLNRVVREALIGEDENLLILDEPTEGFSSEQIQRFPEILNQTGSEQVIIVSHEQDIESLADFTVKIVKENGISSINEQGNFK